MAILMIARSIFRSIKVTRRQKSKRRKMHFNFTVVVIVNN